MKNQHALSQIGVNWLYGYNLYPQLFEAGTDYIQHYQGINRSPSKYQNYKGPVNKFIPNFSVCKK